MSRPIVNLIYRISRKFPFNPTYVPASHNYSSQSKLPIFNSRSTKRLTFQMKYGIS